MERHQTRRVLVLAALIAAVIGLAATDVTHDAIATVIGAATRVIEAHPVAGKLVFFALSLVSAMAAFVSTAVVVPVAVYAWGPVTTVLLLWTAWLAGGMCSYSIGFTLGRRIASWLISPQRMEYYATRISGNAGFLTVLLFQLAMPSEVPGYVLGAVRYRFAIYLGALALAELPFAIGAVYLGDSFLHRNYALLFAVGVAGLALSVLAFHHLHKRIDSSEVSHVSHTAQVQG